MDLQPAPNVLLHDAVRHRRALAGREEEEEVVVEVVEVKEEAMLENSGSFFRKEPTHNVQFGGSGIGKKNPEF